MDDRKMLSQPPFFERLAVSFFHLVNKYIAWYKLPAIIGALNLASLRTELRGYNLEDGYASAAAQGNPTDDPMPDPRFLKARNSDGKFNSLELPLMGCAGMRFGRNFPRKYCQKPSEKELMTPNPRLVSERLMTRKEFVPATTLNLLAAAWIQFQTHDWFNHDLSDEAWDIPLIPDDQWHSGAMKIMKTKPDAVLDPSDIKCPGYRNLNTPWWDGSQIYGSSEAVTAGLRFNHPDGKIELIKRDGEWFLARDAAGNVETGFSNNWWIGMEILHTLFAMEHNALCDMFRKEHPDWKGDQIFDKARLVNCALMAKIHTIEWTPAILAHPTLQLAMNANWWGLAGETLTKHVGRISSSEVISGIPGSGADQDGIPYSLTEEFVSVYRMHALVPDNIAFFKSKTGTHEVTIPTVDMTFSHAQEPFQKGLTFGDVFYSFGINYPGAITHNNYPDFLRHLDTPDGLPRRDMGTVDIFRDRERGVPRYTTFRRLLRLSVPKTFVELTGGNMALAETLAEVYNGDIDAVDALVGSHSEPLIPGFGFSETAFRIFIVMASRRLRSDRFIATQWNADTYTREGLSWVQNTGMKDILVRHFPELAGPLKKSKNVFAPWPMLPESKKYTGIETNAPPKK